MTPTLTNMTNLPPKTRGIYLRALRLLKKADIPFLVGGAYALAHYTGIVRHTKDLDVFVRLEHCQSALDVLAEDGFRTEITFSHWLGKAFLGEDLIDFIFSSGNGICKVDDLWFAHATPGDVLGEEVLLCPPEEMIWSKAFICERERFDGADINHLLRAWGRNLDWDRLLARFDSHWPVLLSHLILFGYTYPSDREVVPAEVVRDLADRFAEEWTSSGERLCRGPLLSRIQYLIDLERWGYEDARLAPEPTMLSEEAAVWTEAGLREQRPRKQRASAK